MKVEPQIRCHRCKIKLVMGGLESWGTDADNNFYCATCYDKMCDEEDEKLKRIFRQEADDEQSTG